MIRFRFELYPLDEMSPWGSDQPRLHWFGLTEGWYWLEASGQELLCRTREVHPHPYIARGPGRLSSAGQYLPDLVQRGCDQVGARPYGGVVAPQVAPGTTTYKGGA